MNDFRACSCVCKCMCVCVCVSTQSYFLQSCSLLWISESGRADIDICLLQLIIWSTEEKVYSREDFIDVTRSLIIQCCSNHIYSKVSSTATSVFPNFFNRSLPPQKHKHHYLGCREWISKWNRENLHNFSPSYHQDFCNCYSIQLTVTMKTNLVTTTKTIAAKPVPQTVTCPIIA